MGTSTGLGKAKASPSPSPDSRPTASPPATPTHAPTLRAPMSAAMSRQLSRSPVSSVPPTPDGGRRGAAHMFQGVPKQALPATLVAAASTGHTTGGLQEYNALRP